jgi:hypothetical protein
VRIHSRLAETLVQVSDEVPVILPPEDDQREIPKLMGRALAKSVESVLEDMMEPAKLIARNPEQKREAWLIDDHVYLAPQNVEFDRFGKPLGARWECGINHWNHFFGSVKAQEGWRKVGV